MERPGRERVGIQTKPRPRPQLANIQIYKTDRYLHVSLIGDCR